MAGQLLLLVFACLFLAGSTAYSRAAKKGKTVSLPGLRARRGKSLPERTPPTFRLPYRYLEHHLLVYEDHVWTALRYPGVTDEHLTAEELETAVRQASTVLASLAGAGKVRTMTRLTHRPFRADQWALEHLDDCWDPTPNYVETVHRQAEMLIDLGTTRPEAYLLVQVGRVRGGSATTRARTLEAHYAGVADEQFDEAVIRSWQDKAAEVHGQLARQGLTPATRSDLLWLIRKSLHGHLTPGEIRDVDVRPWGRGEFHREVRTRLQNLRSHLILTQAHSDEYDDTVELGIDEDSHVAHLVVSSWPKEQRLNPDRSLLRFCARRLPGVEVASHEDLLSPSEFARLVTTYRQDILDEIADADRAKRKPPASLLTQLDQADELLARIDEEDLVGVFSRVILQVSAPTLDELERQVRYVTDEFQQEISRDAGVERPYRCQLQLLANMLPGDRTEIPGNPLVRLTELESVAMRLPDSSSEVGDRATVDHAGRRIGGRGAYLGLTMGGVYFHSPRNSMARRGGAGTVMIGGSGSGKTTAALLVFHYESESGVLTTVCDPKIDFANFVYYLCFGPQVLQPGFDQEAREGVLGTPQSQFTVTNERYWRDTEIIDVTRATAGWMDAFCATDSVAEGALLAGSQLQTLLGVDAYRDIQVVVTEALSRVTDRWERDLEAAGGDANRVVRPTNGEVVETLSSMLADAESAQTGSRRLERLEMADTLLRQLRGLPQARLFFAASGDHPRRRTDRPRRTIYTLRDIVTPAPGSDEATWEPQQRFGAAILSTLAYLENRELDSGLTVHRSGHYRRRPALYITDEANVVIGTPAGAEMARRNLSQGRSYGRGIVLIDQLVGRLAQLEDATADETGGNQLSTVYVFRHATVREARKALPLIQREGNEAVARDLAELGVGEAIVRDLDGRVSTVSLDTCFTELLHASDTNNSTYTESRSVPISPHVADWTFTGGDDAKRTLARAQEAMEAAAALAAETTSDVDAPDPDVDVAPGDQVNWGDRVGSTVAGARQ